MLKLYNCAIILLIIFNLPNCRQQKGKNMPEGFEEGFTPEEIKTKEEGRDKAEYGKEEMMKEIDRLDEEIAELEVQKEARKIMLDEGTKPDRKDEFEEDIKKLEIQIKGKKNIQDNFRIKVGKLELKKEIESRKYE